MSTSKPQPRASLRLLLKPSKSPKTSAPSPELDKVDGSSAQDAIKAAHRGGGEPLHKVDTGARRNLYSKGKT